MSDQPSGESATLDNIQPQLNTLKKLLIDEIERELAIEKGHTKDRSFVEPILRDIDNRKVNLRRAIKLLLTTGTYPPGLVPPPPTFPTEQVHTLVNLHAALKELQRNPNEETKNATGRLVKQLQQVAQADEEQPDRGLESDDADDNPGDESSSDDEEEEELESIQKITEQVAELEVQETKNTKG